MPRAGTIFRDVENFQFPKSNSENRTEKRGKGPPPGVTGLPQTSLLPSRGYTAEILHPRESGGVVKGRILFR